MKSAFLNEHETKEQLAEFIRRTDRLSMGEQCVQFENEFAKFQGDREAVLFNSGGSANLAILQTLKNLGRLKEGDKIGFSALTWSTNVMPIIQMGLQPVAIDCEATTLNAMSYNLTERLTTDHIQAFFTTNALGFAGDLDNIQQLCHEKKIILLEDNCEALGTELPAGKTGTFGEMTSFSFFVAHHMSTIEGGMVCTNNEKFAEMLKIVRANGWDRNLNANQQHKWRKKYNVNSEFEAKYTFYDLGYNFRPTEITGFLGRCQLQLLKENIVIREKTYMMLESTVNENSDIITLARSHISVLSNFAFPILCKTRKLRDKYIAQFSGAGVEIRPMIAGNIQKQPFYRKYVSILYELPGTDKVQECGFYCGNYPELTETDIQTLCSCLSKY
ncbi:MAG: DegT/DnrJ/EryC1/StrS aminotransferase family protein [Candidatus Parabeggiatoa sp. nov. 3]|nr:MAG: DegT/DnrJ/EryC1/StrS aminotransferase family protein [Gammaproteobacteria bacterium]